MLSLEFLRKSPDVVRDSLVKRHTQAPLDEVLSLDAQRRALLQHVEALRAQHKELSRRAGRDKLPSLLEDARNLSARIEGLDGELNQVEGRLQELQLQIPNLPHSQVPVGKDDTENVVLRSWGEPRVFPFTPKPHWELGPALGILDLERGARISGSRFFILKGLGARLQRALISFMLDYHTQRHGYTEVYPPYLVRRECIEATTSIAKFGENLYHDAEEDLWLVPTAEVPVTNLHRGEVLEPGILPLYYVAYTACFRREKAAAGRDTRGIKRVHQFDKVELYKFVLPETSDAELDRLVSDARGIAEALELPCRLKQLCTGDLGFSATMSYDLELWAPGCDEWLEVSSCSNCGDFQARRANIRFRREPGARPEFVHTLNGSGLALPRVFIAVLENYQQADGSVTVPQVLRPYLGGLEVIR